MTGSIRPSLETVRKLSRTFRRIPVSMEIAADLETPVRLLKKLRRSSPDCFLLESMDGGEKWGRYSFLGYDPLKMITVRDGCTTVTDRAGGKQRFSEDPLQVLRGILEQMKAPVFEYLPRFAGGAVGYFGYDMARYAERLPHCPPDEAGYPDMKLMVVDRLIAYDNVRQTMTVIVCMPTDGDLEARYREAEAEIRRVVTRIQSESGPCEAAAETANQPPEWHSRPDAADYMSIVRKAKRYIREGDIFQVVLSRRLTAEMRTGLLDVYRALRVRNPSPYMYYLSMSGIEIAGASPETLVRLENGTLETSPIAGSRPRGRTREEDMKLERELKNDEKELAEHSMLVDLGRNDLGRISLFGSVQVKDYAQVARYSQIMHLTTLVYSRIRPEYDACDALRSVLPAGTLSGAPKVRAMEIIDELESARRGVYGGAVGYIGFDGNMDTCIAIRTICCKDGVACVQAGAGIVADSVPENEWAETAHKARAVVLAAEEAGDYRVTAR